jgi:hypothetical protein
VLLLLLAVSLQQVGLGHTVLQGAPAAAEGVVAISRLCFLELFRTSKRSMGGCMYRSCAFPNMPRCTVHNPLAAAVQ